MRSTRCTTVLHMYTCEPTFIFIETVLLSTPNIYYKNDIFVICVCVCGGGSILVKCEKMRNIWILVKIARLVSGLRTRIFSLSQTETFRFIHFIMKLWKWKRPYNPALVAQIPGPLVRSRRDHIC